MKIRSRSGHILNREFHFYKKVYKRANESCVVLGPFIYNRKEYVAIVYFNKWRYYKWHLKALSTLPISLIMPGYYLKTQSKLTDLIQGMTILDHNANLVTSDKINSYVCRIVFIWIEVYLAPFFPHALVKVIHTKTKWVQKISKEIKKRKYPTPRNLAERVYFEQLKIADKQVATFTPIFVIFSKLLKNIWNTFIQVSNRPSEKNILKLRSQAIHLKKLCGRLSLWCEERARTWTDFLDARDLYKQRMEKEKSLFKRYGYKTLTKLIPALLTYFISGGQIPFSLILQISILIGTEGLKMLLSFRWQTRSLLKAAKYYENFKKRIDVFLSLYDMKKCRKNFFRY